MGDSAFKLKNYRISPGFSDDSVNIFEGIFENFPDMIHSVDAAGKIVATNRKATDLLGYTKEELIGMSVFDIYPKSISEAVRIGFEELKRDGVKERIESKLLAKDGTIIDVEIRSLSVYDSEGNFVKTFTVIRDMRELNQLKLQLIQQSKLAAIGELATGIVHDIRNPLSVIVAYNNDVLPKVIASGDLKKMQTIQIKMEKAAARIAKICDHLRAFGRNEVESPESVNVSSFVDDCLLMVGPRIQAAGARLINRVQGSSLTAVFRVAQLEQVLINLLANAADAVEKQVIKEIEISAEIEGEMLVLRVTDSGPGIDPRIHEQIFESFFTTKDRNKGTGLGLSICRGIVSNNQGSLTFASEVGEGATFILKLPVAGPVKKS
jgi:PAS domain S-box-containing protein